MQCAVVVAIYIYIYILNRLVLHHNDIGMNRVRTQSRRFRSYMVDIIPIINNVIVTKHVQKK